MRIWAKKFAGVCRLQSLQYICAPFGPFVQGLGRQVFILETGVRFPYGLPKKTPLRVFFCAQTLDFTSVSEVLGLKKRVARCGLQNLHKYLLLSVLYNSFLLSNI